LEQKGTEIPRIKYYLNVYSISFNLFISNYALENDGMPDIQYPKKSESGQNRAETTQLHLMFTDPCIIK